MPNLNSPNNAAIRHPLHELILAIAIAPAALSRLEGHSDAALSQVALREALKEIPRHGRLLVEVAAVVVDAAFDAVPVEGVVVKLGAGIVVRDRDGCEFCGYRAALDWAGGLL